jgi:hypothetical protein
MSKNLELLQIVGGDDDLFRTSGRLTDIVAKANGESSPELDEETRDRILRNASLPNIFETCNEPSESTSIAAAERSSGLHEESGRGCLQNSTVAEAFRTSKNLTSPIDSPAAPRGLHQSAAVRRSAQLSGPLAEASGRAKSSISSLVTANPETPRELEKAVREKESKRTSTAFKWIDTVKAGARNWGKSIQVRSNHYGSDLEAITREEEIKLVQRVFPGLDQSSPRAVLFAGLDGEAGRASTCARVGGILAARGEGRVCVVDANFRTPS